MRDWSSPLNDVADAEAYFRAMGCSHFHMTREYPNRYEEYRKFDVSTTSENQWTQSEFDNQVTALYAETNRSELWNRFSSLCRLANLLRTRDVVEKLAVAAARIEPAVPDPYRILMAEILLGINGAWPIREKGPVEIAIRNRQHALVDSMLGEAKRFSIAASAPIGGPPLQSRLAKVAERVPQLSRQAKRRRWWLS